MKALLLIALLSLMSCDKDAESDPGARPATLLAERLVEEFGEGVLAQPSLTVYDEGWILGRGTTDPEFSAKAAKLGVARSDSLSAGMAPVAVREFYSQEGVEFGLNDVAEKVVVVEANSRLNIRLLLGKSGIEALRGCEKVNDPRVCSSAGEVRVQIIGGGVRGLVLTHPDGDVIGEGKMNGDWAIFDKSMEVGEDTELEVILAGGVHCRLSKWVLEPRDSCQM